MKKTGNRINHVDPFLHVEYEKPVQRKYRRVYKKLDMPLEEIKFLLDDLSEQGIYLTLADAAGFIYGVRISSRVSMLVKSRELKYEIDEKGRKRVKPQEVLRILREGKYGKWKIIKDRPKKPKRSPYRCRDKSKEEIIGDLERFSEAGTYLSFADGNEILSGSRRSNSIHYLIKRGKIEYVTDENGKKKIDPEALLKLIVDGYGRFGGGKRGTRRKTERFDFSGKSEEEVIGILREFTENGKYLDSYEAVSAIYGGKDTSTLRTLIDNGNLTVNHKKGRSRFFDPENIVKIIKSGKYGRFKVPRKPTENNANPEGQPKTKLKKTEKVLKFVTETTFEKKLNMLREELLKEMGKLTGNAGKIKHSRVLERASSTSKEDGYHGLPVTKTYVQQELNRLRTELEKQFNSFEKRMLEKTEEIKNLLINYIEERNKIDARKYRDIEKLKKYLRAWAGKGKEDVQLTPDKYDGEIEDIGKDGYHWAKGAAQFIIRLLDDGELESIRESVKYMLGKEPLSDPHYMVVGLSKVLHFLRKDQWKRNQLIKNFSDMKKLKEKGKPLYRELLRFIDMNPECTGVQADIVNSQIIMMMDKWEKTLYEDRIKRTGKSREEID